MAKVRLLGGKPLLVGGKVALTDDCCCGGVCCLYDFTTFPTCQEGRTEEDCLNAGGIFHPGESCSDVTCFDACCFGTYPDQTCVVMDYIECFLSGGINAFDFRSCSPNPCCPRLNLHFAASGTVDLSDDCNGCPTLDYDSEKTFSLGLDPGCTISISDSISSIDGAICRRGAPCDPEHDNVTCDAVWNYSFTGGPAGWSFSAVFSINCDCTGLPCCSIEFPVSGSGSGNDSIHAFFDFCSTTVEVAIDIGFS